tara:strand:- start:359 stop:1345 length:987 start_codon:yes stop_codon:yes gene_type:complete
MTQHNIKYSVDSIEGNSLVTTITDLDHGWVEYCNQRGQLVYIDSVDEEFYKKCQTQAINLILKYIVVKDQKQLGFIHHLSSVLLNDEFVMPMFAVLPTDATDPKITAGITRMIAAIANGRGRHEFKTVIFVPKTQSWTHLENARCLNSTVDFETIYNLKGIDYEISMSDNADTSQFKFERSVLKYTIYDQKDQALPHTLLGARVTNFWDQHMKNNKIELNIRCTPEVGKLIQDSKIFNCNITHEDSQQWRWSLGQTLNSFRKDQAPVDWEKSPLHLWLYDICEPINLELLLPWVSEHNACYQTKNKKALFFNNHNDFTHMQVTGNWVQ